MKKYNIHRPPSIAIPILLLIISTAFQGAIWQPSSTNNMIKSDKGAVSLFSTAFGKAKFHSMKMPKRIADSLFRVSDIQNFIFQLTNPDGFFRHEYILQVWVDRGGQNSELPTAELLEDAKQPAEIDKKADIGIYKLSFDNFKKIFNPDQSYSYLKFLPSKTSDEKSVEYTVSMANSAGEPIPDEAKKFLPQTMHPSPPAGFD